MGWCGNNICLAFKKEYKLLHDESETLVPIHVDFKSSPLIKVCVSIQLVLLIIIFLSSLFLRVRCMAKVLPAEELLLAGWLAG
jgi:hypothetical protein